MTARYIIISCLSIFLFSACASDMAGQRAVQAGVGGVVGAGLGALVGAAACSKGKGRRSDCATRGAYAGAVAGAAAGWNSPPPGSTPAPGYSGGGTNYYSSQIPAHCQGYSNPRQQRVCAEAAWKEAANMERQARQQADKEASERGKSWQ